MAYLIHASLLALLLQMVASNPSSIEGSLYLGSLKLDNGPTTKATSYYLVKAAETWDNAFKNCDSSGGKLVSLKNPIVDDAIRTLLFREGFADSRVWSGGRRNSNSIWQWVPIGTHFVYKNWLPPASYCGDHQEGCLAALVWGYQWGWCGDSCSNRYIYVCEY